MPSLLKSDRKSELPVRMAFLMISVRTEASTGLERAFRVEEFLFSAPKIGKG